ncbi:hypothetical protein [Marinobacterium sedimentorum]|uniref:hypothetical protein n=1 Tax=Marinobacterium sedimentorum TaxID=2927804 RepID=UPI0020C6917C|nr:hypothetical protein [Marinobacterium sedimentorum]MCP8687734.1 hypothetical protein [Marinobacterium sedimentorum]
MSTEENVYDVYWEGPFNYDDLRETESHEDLVLYAIYGTHPLYGRNVLLYIGITENLVTTRLSQHSWWIDGEPDPCGVYMASIGKFESWAKSQEFERYPKMDPATTRIIESLLIYSHQPIYNQRNKNSASLAKNYRAFNTGRRGMLLGEVSGLYYLGD